MKYKMERGLEGQGQLSVRTSHELIPEEEDPSSKASGQGCRPQALIISSSLSSVPPPSLSVGLEHQGANCEH